MSKRDCDFLDKVRRMQRRWWLALLFWSICVVLLVAVIREVTHVPHVLVYAMFYGTSYFLLIQLIALYQLKCPHCHWFAGAVPYFRYKFLECKACGKRIICNR